MSTRKSLVILFGAGVAFVGGLLTAQAPPNLSATSSSSWVMAGARSSNATRR